MLALGLALAVSGAAGEATVAGDWAVSWDDAYGPQTGTLALTLEGDALSGTFATQGVEATLTGTFQAPNATFTIDMPQPDGSTSKIEVSAVVEGDSVSGTAVDRGMTIPFTGKRKAKEEPAS
jgi:hypothetical protein